MPTLETQISFAHVGFVCCPMETTGSKKSFRYKFRYGATTSGSQIHPVGKLRAHSRVYQIESRSRDTKISENCSSQSNATNKKPISIGLFLYDLYVQYVCQSLRSLHMNNMYNISA